MSLRVNVEQESWRQVRLLNKPSFKLFLHVFKIAILEAERQEQINKASGEAEAIIAVSLARAKGLNMVGQALMSQVYPLKFMFSKIYEFNTYFLTERKRCRFTFSR